MKLVIYPAMDDSRLQRLRSAAPDLDIVSTAEEADARREIADAEAFFGKMTPEILASAHRLEWVQSPTASLEHYLFPELVEHPSRLSNMRGLYSDIIADHVMGYVLCFARNLLPYIRQQAEGRWAPVGDEGALPNFVTGPSEISPIDASHLHLADCTLGVVGVGSIGREICRRASAFSMRLLGVDPVCRSVDGVLDQVWPSSDLPRLLRESDFVVVAAPHTPETEGLFGADRFAEMRKSTYFINIGRGAIVKLDALTKALEDGAIAGAAIDVAEVEPLPPDHPLWRMDNVIITPHVAAASPRVAERHFQTLAENVRLFSQGEDPTTLVDKRLWY